MARSKPKKVFYNRRHKLPAWGQLYAVWGIAAALSLIILFFTSVEIVSRDPAPALATTTNGFAEGLFYDLREAEPGSEDEAVRAYAKRLEKKHDYKVSEKSESGCKTLRLSHGPAPRYGIATAPEKGKGQDVFALLTFLDRIVPHHTTASVEGVIIIPGKNCDATAALAAFQRENHDLPVILGTGDLGQNYDRAFHFKNLKIRRHFEQAFFMRERTLWANVMSLVQSDSSAAVILPVKNAWPESPAAALAQNPLLKHPLVAKIPGSELSKPAGVYLSADAQLTSAGLIVLIILLWLGALIPLANAIGTFREKTDIISAATSTVLYAFTFFAYFSLLKITLRFAKSDFSVILVTLILLPLIFIPVSILQKNLLRAELNRPGLHILILLGLTVSLILNPLAALPGFICLMLSSGFSRAAIGPRILRVVLIIGVFAVFYLITRQPLGSFSNFFAALLPAFDAGGVPRIILLSIIGGNLASLFFVPRERN